ncbi:MAG: DesA family fatty acid desaturase [Gammaproteobacteria bacterium]
MATGLLDVPVWGYFLATLLFTHLTIIGVTVYLHRCMAHRALELHPAASHFLRFWLWLTTGMNTLQWVAVHRKHHAFVEAPEDPHSPQVHGLNKVLFQGTELYRDASRVQETLERYGHGCPDDWVERNLYTPHAKLGILSLLAIHLLMFGPFGLTIWSVQMMWIPFWAAGVVNGVGHYSGYRNYECPDASTNICPWGILIGGEELHNNHHAFAGSAKLSSKWWEFDIGWMYIRILEMLRLARVKKLPPRLGVVPGKSVIDVETVRALIANRLHIMALYAREVVKPVHQEELRKAEAPVRSVLKRTRRLLSREGSLLDERAKLRLQSALAHSRALEVVYQFRLELQRLWEERTATHESLLRALQEWCRQAEETGIRALQDFAASLQYYTLKTA